jgi:hypothetical protein
MCYFHVLFTRKLPSSGLVTQWKYVEISEERAMSLFYLEDGGSTFVRNVDKIKPG